MEHRSAKFVANRLAMPLFMVSRQSIKRNYSKELNSYIRKKSESYTKSCQLENAIANETATFRYMKHITGFDDGKPPTVCKASYKKPRNAAQSRLWQMPPNRYDVVKEPFKNRKGMAGAYWSKRPAEQFSEKRVTKSRFKFYNTPRETEKMQGVCHKHKGVLVSNARERKASSRNMITDIALCYRDPSEPSPTTYNTFSNNLEPPTRLDSPIDAIYEFYRMSSVAVKENSCHPRHTSFLPGPGRYEIRYPNICFCFGNRLYQPELQMLIDREKRFKFRRQPFNKIKARQYCAPDWLHVKGHGFRYLFKGGKQKITEPLANAAKNLTARKIKKGKEVKVNYADARYIHTITDPLRRPLSLRFEPLPKIPPRIEFNCLRKPTVRKTLRINKTVVFGSGQSRFKGSQRRVQPVTLRQLEALKQKLPLERQLRDQPIMSKSPEAIKPKLHNIPKRFISIDIGTRLKDFKFSPLPEPRILVTKNDVRYEADAENGFYFKALKPENFFKLKEVEDTTTA